MARITAARALTAHFARRMIRLATLIAVIVFLAALILCGALAYLFTAWWWLLLIPFVFIMSVLLLVRLIVSFFVSRVYSRPLTTDQKQALDELTEKLERLIEARGTPPMFFVFITIKDVLLHKDIKTVKEIIRDSTTLKRDYDSLERLF